jgi:hypothetical protein
MRLNVAVRMLHFEGRSTLSKATGGGLAYKVLMTHKKR